MSDQCMATLGSQPHLGTPSGQRNAEICVPQLLTLDWFGLSYALLEQTSENQVRIKQQNKKSEA